MLNELLLLFWSGLELGENYMALRKWDFFFFNRECVWKILCENARRRKNIAKYNLPPDGMYVEEIVQS